jgi:hypothetical protein
MTVNNDFIMYPVKNKILQTNKKPGTRMAPGSL